MVDEAKGLGELDTLPRESGSPVAEEANVGGLVPGTMLDDTYRVERLLGRGAMGAVYEVEHVALGKRFAAKVVTEARALDAQAVRRLRNEARITSALEHDNIVRVTHLGTTEDNVLFIVMELLEGQSLRDRLHARDEDKHAPAWLPDDETRPILAQVLSGLAAAHEGGVVHRDLKPDNVFLVSRREGVRAKIVDFGISKVRPGAGVDADVSLTQTGTVVGTPLYMAPEQMRPSEETNARSDLYSVGVMAYEMLTGVVPFEASSLHEIIVMQALEQAAPITDSRPELPPGVSRVIERALAKEPEERWGSADEMLEAWDSAWEVEVDEVVEPRSRPVVQAVQTVERAAEKPPSRVGLWVGLIALLLAGGAWFGMSAFDSPAPTLAPPAADPVAETTRVEDVEPPPAAPIVPPGHEPPEHVGPALIEREIRTQPSGASALVDGQRVGTTPFPLRFARGSEVAVVLRSPGYRERRITVTEDDEPVVEVRLRPQTSHQPELAPLIQE